MKKETTTTTTRYGNYFLTGIKHSFFYRPKKGSYTAILEFEVIKPQHELEAIGERLRLSAFGEYCPDNSLRGYQLEELLIKADHYRPRIIAQMGEKILLNYA